MRGNFGRLDLCCWLIGGLCCVFACCRLCLFVVVCLVAGVLIVLGLYAVISFGVGGSLLWFDCLVYCLFVVLLFGLLFVGLYSCGCLRDVGLLVCLACYLSLVAVRLAAD